MESGKESSDNKDLSVDTLPDKPRFVTCGLWVLCLIALLGIMSGRFATILLSVCIIIVLWIISKRISKIGGAPLSDILFPPRLSKRIRASGFFRKYVFAPIKTPWVIIMIFVNIIPTIWLLVMLPYWFTPVLELNEMQTYTGVIERLNLGGRKDPIGHLWLRTSDGKVTEFLFNRSDVAFQYLKKLTDKDEVKIWANIEWRTIFRGGERIIKQVQHNDFVAYKYDKYSELRAASSGKKSGGFCAVWLFFSCMIVWVKFCKYEEEIK